MSSSFLWPEITYLPIGAPHTIPFIQPLVWKSRKSHRDNHKTEENNLFSDAKVKLLDAEKVFCVIFWL